MHKHYHGFNKKVLNKYDLVYNNIIAKYDNTLRIKLNIGDYIDSQIFFLGYYDKRGICFIKNFLNNGDIFIDIGANIGCYSLIAAKKVDVMGRVICFEAINETYNKLNYNIELNNLSNVTTNNLAIYNCNNELKLHTANNKNSGMSSIHQHDSQNGNIEVCKAITLDYYIKNNPLERIDLIKIDIEGAEMHALEGMNKTIEIYKPSFIIELSDDVLKNTPINKNDIINFLKKKGYEIYAIDDNGELVNSKNPNNNYKNFVFINKKLQ